MVYGHDRKEQLKEKLHLKIYIPLLKKSKLFIYSLIFFYCGEIYITKYTILTIFIQFIYVVAQPHYHPSSELFIFQ